jgi:DNA recombination protein RmuC
VEQYNKFVGTLESRVLVTARRMHELHLTSERPPTLEPLEVAARSLSAAELTDDLGRSVRDDAFLERTASDGRPDGATTSSEDETVHEQSA